MPAPRAGPPASTARAAGRTISRLVSSCRPAWSASKAAPPAAARRVDVAACERDRGERGVGLGAPRRVARQERQQLLRPAPPIARRARRAPRPGIDVAAVRGTAPASRGAAPPRAPGGRGPRSARTPVRSRSPCVTARSRCRRMPSASPAAGPGPCRARSRADAPGSATGPSTRQRPPGRATARPRRRRPARAGSARRRRRRGTRSTGRPGAWPRGGPPRPARCARSGTTLARA